MKYAPLPDEMERIGKEIVDSAYRVHKELGPGLLESVYEECMVYDLRRKGIRVETQVHLPIEFDGHVIEQGRLRIDMIVDGAVVVENKAVVEMVPLYQAQMLTYLRLGRMRLGYLINYNVNLIKNGIKRFVV